MANELQLVDDYEEGEIFDEDNLYDDVSSMEEFEDAEPCQKKKKEHKCLENSLCRKERTGKLCHARLKNITKSDDDVKIVAVYPAPDNSKPDKRKIGTSRDDKNRYRSRKHFNEKKRRVTFSKRKFESTTNASLLQRLVSNGTIKKQEAEAPKEEDIDERIHYLQAINQPELEIEDDSIELLKLRTEALKSAMCRRLAGKKINVNKSVDDSITEYVLSNIEPQNEPEVEKVEEAKVEKTAKKQIKYLRELHPNGKLRKAKRNIMLKRRKKSITRIALANKSNQQTDDTEELRQLALMSVKNKINKEMKPLTIEIAQEEVSKSTPSSTDQWEDVDEDILRAQLLSEISDKIPMNETKDDKTGIKKINKENLKKTIDKKIQQNKKINKILDKKNKTPVVDRFVICVTGDTSSDDENDNQKINSTLYDQIDNYLEQVRKEQEFEIKTPTLVKTEKQKQQALDSPTNTVKIQTIKTEILTQDKFQNVSQIKKEPLDPSSQIKQEPVETKVMEKLAIVSTSTDAVTNLPVWQQEEYIRLTKRIAENELKRKAATANVAKKLKQELPIKKQVIEKLPEVKTEVENVTKKCKENWKHSDDFNEMSSMVDSMEKGLNNMNKIKNNLAIMRKELALEQNKYRNQKQTIIAIKDKLQDKRKLINDKILSNFHGTEKESELIRLKFKELDLKAQIVCHNLTATTKPNLVRNETPKRKLKGKFLPINKPRLKRLRTKSEWDPFNPYCPYEMAGYCKDEDCKFQHNS